MSAANEGFDVNTLLGANLLTSSATCTLRVINYGEIILYLDCAVRTGLLTLHTADTAVGASLVGYSTLVMAGALNNNASLFAYNVDNVVGTGLLAKATADTESGIDIRNTVFGIDNDSIVRTNGNTVTVAKTSIAANGVTRVRELCRLTGLNTVVNVLSVLGLAMSVTSNVCNLAFNLACCETHDLCKLSRNVSTAGDTEAGVVGLTFAKSLCISVTTRITASTAVSTGKTVTNSNNLFIFLNCKEGSGNSKNYRTDNRNYRKNG